ncbi:MAG TPA: hypothetical protein VKA13_01185 [Gammaproteobacteria bacterium]|nr:hypothetical protein [Gammaproteobacteria bacterium]
MVDINEIEEWHRRGGGGEGSGSGKGDDLIPWILLIVNIIMLGMLVIATFISGIFAATSHPGDRLLNIIYAAVVYTSPYVLYNGLGLALYILKKSRAITYTYTVGVLTLAGLWVYKNVLSPEEDVSFGYSLYDTLHDNFVISALVAGGFAIIVIMQTYLMMPEDYHQH